MPDIGSGVREIRIRDRSGEFWVLYVATTATAIYFLHAFQKKTRATPRLVLELARSRFRQIDK